MTPIFLRTVWKLLSICHFNSIGLMFLYINRYTILEWNFSLYFNNMQFRSY